MDIKYVFLSEGLPTPVTIEMEIIKGTTDMPPNNLDRLLRERIQEDLVLELHSDAESNNAKEVLNDFVLFESVDWKIAQTFVDAEVMQTSKTQFILQHVEKSVNYAA